MVCLGVTESGESHIDYHYQYERVLQRFQKEERLSREVQNYVRRVVIALSVPTTILQQKEDYPDPEMNLPFVRPNEGVYCYKRCTCVYSVMFTCTCIQIYVDLQLPVCLGILIGIAKGDYHCCNCCSYHSPAVVSSEWISDEFIKHFKCQRLPHDVKNPLCLEE